MADGFNRVMLLGNLGADPDLRYTQSGQPILKLRLATTESYLDANKVRQERTEWHNVVMWGKRGESLSRYLNKGATIFVEGSLRTRSYEKNGEKRYVTEIHATEIRFAGGGREGGQRESAPRPQRQPASYGPHANEDFDPPPDDDFGNDDIPF